VRAAVTLGNGRSEVRMYERHSRRAGVNDCARSCVAALSISAAVPL
jgi:hypothetical protein